MNSYRVAWNVLSFCSLTHLLLVYVVATWVRIFHLHVQLSSTLLLLCARGVLLLIITLQMLFLQFGALGYSSLDMYVAQILDNKSARQKDLVILVTLWSFPLPKSWSVHRFCDVVYVNLFLRTLYWKLWNVSYITNNEMVKIVIYYSCSLLFNIIYATLTTALYDHICAYRLVYFVFCINVICAYNN